MSKALDFGVPIVTAEKVGSRVTCNPPPTGTDEDWLVLVNPDEFDGFAEHLLESGWEVAGSLIDYADNTLPEDERFNSFRKGELNVIATASAAFYKRFMAATSVAKLLNLLKKSDRINLFQAVLYGQSVGEQTESIESIFQ